MGRGKEGCIKHIIESLENIVLKSFEGYENGYCLRKFYISDLTGIPEDVLTVLLKRLKDAGKIEIQSTFSEINGLADGSGYRIKK